MEFAFFTAGATKIYFYRSLLYLQQLLLFFRAVL